MKEAISAVSNKKFGDFTKKVTASLKDKLENNPIIKVKKQELQDLSKVKDMFNKISKTYNKETPKDTKPEEVPNEPEAPTDTKPEEAPTDTKSEE